DIAVPIVVDRAGATDFRLARGKRNGRSCEAYRAGRAGIEIELDRPGRTGVVELDDIHLTVMVPIDRKGRSAVKPRSRIADSDFGVADRSIVIGEDAAHIGAVGTVQIEVEIAVSVKVGPCHRYGRTG